MRSGYLTLALSRHKIGRKCYVTPEFSGVHITERGEQNQKWQPHPCLVGGPKECGNATSPLQTRGPQRQAHGAQAKVLPNKGNKTRSGYLTPALSRPKIGWKCYVTPAFSGVHIPNRGGQNQKWLYHPLLLGGPKEGTHATSPSHFRGSPMPRAWHKIRSGCLTPAFSGGQTREEMIRYLCILGGPQPEARGAK